MSKIRNIATKKNLFVVLLEIALWGGGQMLGHIHPVLGASIWFIATLILIYLVLPVNKWSDWLLGHRTPSKARKVLASILFASPIVMLGLVVYLSAWSNIVSLFTPSSPMIIYENTQNAFISPTVVQLQDGQYQNGLLVEFGTRFTDAQLDAELTLSSDFSVISEYWDKQGLDKPSSDAVPLTGTVTISDLGSEIKLGKAQIVEHDTIPPTYRIYVKTVMVTPSRSFYVFFAGTNVLSIESARFDDKTLDDLMSK